MGLHELTLRNFRLFSEFTFTPDHGAITVFFSPNGTGKTSVLEAVFALATGSSFRTSAAGDLIKTSEQVAEIHGVLFQQTRRIQVDLVLTKGVRNTTKKMLVNGQRPKSRALLSEVLPLTVFTPEGVDIVRRGPEPRRMFLTNLLTDVNPNTADRIEKFDQVLVQRNAFLRSLQGDTPRTTQQKELDVWDEEFCEAATHIIEIRLQLLEKLRPLVTNYYHAISESSLDVGVLYERSWQGQLRDALRDALHHDMFRGFSTVGPQRDDILLTLSGRDARRQASQGEQRSLALALRLAGHELVRHERGLDPLLLLDDVFSELDPQRSERLLQLLPVGQTLVTTASPLPSSMNPSAIIDLSEALL